MRGRINPVRELCIIFHGSIDFDGLGVLPVSGGESLCYVRITWWFPVSERDILGILVHKIYSLPYVYGESGYNVGWMSMCTVLCGGPPSFHCISLVLR